MTKRKRITVRIMSSAMALMLLFGVFGAQPPCPYDVGEEAPPIFGINLFNFSIPCEQICE